jgi:hypothetical protein
MSDKTFKHVGGGGDMIYGLATMRQLGGGILHLNSSWPSFFESLLLLQPYVTKIEYHLFLYQQWQELQVDYNLDLFREINHNTFPVVECHRLAFNLDFDLTEPWLFNVEPKHVADIVINDTGNARFPGDTVEWSLLKPYVDRCVFIGVDQEYEEFEKNKFKVKRHILTTALEFAQIIKGSKLYVANQSCGLAMAEGMKHPRVADLYYGPAKQYPYGDNGYYELTTELIEKYLGE